MPQIIGIGFVAICWWNAWWILMHPHGYLVLKLSSHVKTCFGKTSWYFNCDCWAFTLLVQFWHEKVPNGACPSLLWLFCPACTQLTNIDGHRCCNYYCYFYWHYYHFYYYFFYYYFFIPRGSHQVDQHWWTQNPDAPTLLSDPLLFEQQFMVR